MAAEAPSASAPLISARHISKTFGGARALVDVSLEVAHGEVHGLLGENGSGKSTLIKVLAGFHDPEPGGELLVNGEAVKLPLAPGDFRQLGFSFVHQDLGLIPSLSVLENLRIGALAQARGWHVSWAREKAQARSILREVGLNLDLRTPVEQLSAVDRALLAIARAFAEVRAEAGDGARGGGLVVLDEPTVFLPRTGIQRLFALIRDIVKTGASVLYVSHDLDDVRMITDRVTVLRDGRNRSTVVTREVDEAALIELIVGRQLSAYVPTAKPTSVAAPSVQVQDLASDSLMGVSFAIERGEVLGITGLAGSGFEAVPYFLFGGAHPDRGRLSIGGVAVELAAMTPSKALALGLALVPADRRRDGSAMSLSLTDNITLLQLRRFFRGLGLRRGKMVQATKAQLREFDVRPAKPEILYGSLSGGNQQKALLAKWLQQRPALLLLHEPTQGVDVGARQQIFAFIRDSAAAGGAVLCASSDYEQLATISDRVLILSRGRIAAELTGDDVTKERITSLAYAG